MTDPNMDISNILSWGVVIGVAVLAVFIRDWWRNRR